MCGDRHPTKASVTFHDLVETTLKRGAGPTRCGWKPAAEDPGRAQTRQAVAEHVDLVVCAGGNVNFHDLVGDHASKGAAPTPGPPRPLINNPHRLSQAETRALGQFRMPPTVTDSQRESVGPLPTPCPAAAAPRHRGRATEPLYRARRTLHTGADLLTNRQRARLDRLVNEDTHVEVETTWAHLSADDHRPPRTRPRPRPAADAATDRLPQPWRSGSLAEVITLGRTLKQGAADVLAYVDRPGTSNGGTEAICECGVGWSGTGWSGWFRSCCPVCDSRSNWPVSAVSFR